MLKHPEPTVALHLGLAWEAWARCHEARSFHDNGPNRVSVETREAVLSEVGVDDPEEREEFRLFIRTLDAEYVAWHRAELAKQRQQQQRGK